MDLLSAFKRKTSTAAPAEAADAVQRARTRARQRLIGAAVLVVAGIIGFPLLFETQPRPIPVDLPIEIPRKESMPALAMPGPVAPAPAAASSLEASPPVRAAVPAEHVITETEAEAGREVTATAAAPSASAASPARPAGESTSKRVATAAAAAARPADGARAQALLEGKPPAAAASEAAVATQRFVVQVGAFAEPSAVKEARARVEKLGLQTYTQVAETPAGARTRVRVGPFATRDEAERAAAKIKAAALPAAILSL